MNAQILKTYLRPFVESKSITDSADAADKIATAYDLANIGSSGPFFGAKLLKGDKETLKSFIQLGLEVNLKLSAISSDKDKVEPGFTLIALGFCLYWLNSTFTPVPPMPPMIAPTTGCQVLFPGIPKPLDKELQDSMKKKDSEQALSDFANALIKHQLTIAGIYSGLAPAVPSPIPLVLPWFAVLSLPDIGIKLPDFLKNQDTDKDGIPDLQDDDIDGDGIPNTQDDDIDGDGILNKDEPGTINVGAGGGGTGGGGTGGGGTGGGGTGGGGTGGGGTGGGTGADPNFDPKTGFDNSPDDKFIDYVNLGSDGNLRPIDEIYIDQDSTTQDFFAKLIKDKLSANKFKPELIVDSRQRTKNKNEPGYRNAYLQITVELREQVVKQITGDDEYQFYMTVDMANTGVFSYWDTAQRRFVDTPIAIGFPKSKFTFRDTIVSPNSIWAGPPFNIVSPKQRGLELMRIPFNTILDQKLGEFNSYIDTYFNSRLRKKLQKIDLYLTTEPREDFNPFGNQVFTKMTNFVKLP